MELLVSKSFTPSDRVRQYDKSEIAHLPNFSISVAEGAYKLQAKQGFVAIDNEKGMGETPNGKNVLYRGFVAVLDTATLMSLFPDMRARESDSFVMLDNIKQGYGVASPMFDIDIDPFIDNTSGFAKITGHEGRARIWAMSKLGVKQVPVSFIIEGYRARHVKDRSAEFFKWLNEGIVKQRSELVIKGVFSEILFG